MSTNSKKHGPSIFISYRIADTLQVADRLAAGLRDTFGAEAVFFDRRTIEPGDAWNSEIESAVKGDWGMSDVLNLLNLHLGSPQVLLFACPDNHSSTQREHCTLSLRRKNHKPMGEETCRLDQPDGSEEGAFTGGRGLQAKGLQTRLRESEIE